MSNQHSQFHQHASNNAARGSRKKPSTISRVLLAVILAMFGASLVLDYPNWQIAHVLNLYEQGNRDDAINQLVEFVEDKPYNESLKKDLIEMMLNNGRSEEALELIESLEGTSGFNATERKITALQRLGRFEEAFKLFKQYGRYDSLNSNDRADRMNQLAYMRALAGIELNRAGDDISKVIDDINTASNNSIGADLPVELKMRIWAAYLYDECEQPGKGIDLLTPVVDKYTDKWLLNQNKSGGPKNDKASMLETVFQQFGQYVSGQDQKNIEVFKTQFAWVLTARAYLLEKNGNFDAAKVDREFVFFLKHDPNEILAKVPNANNCFYHLQKLSAYVDTKALVLDKQDDNDVALQLFNEAIIAGEAIICASEANSITVSPINMMADKRYRSAYLESVKFGIAAMVNHRFNLFNEIGQFNQAKKDAQYIRELGFEPGIELN